MTLLGLELGTRNSEVYFTQSRRTEVSQIPNGNITRAEFKKYEVTVTGTNKQTNKQTPWPSVRKRTIPTERPPLVSEI
jgi:hypothetical protein